MPTADFTTLRASFEGAVGRLTLNRPEKLNPLGTATLLELADAARWFDAQAGVKVVVVSGAGRSFSAGADLASFGDPSANAGLSVREAADAGELMADAVGAMRAVTVAAVHGHCIGGGVVLVAACDLRVAAEDTYFSIPEIDLGIPLAWGGVPRLVREIGPARTRELVMTCRPFTAAEALAFGFLNRVVPADLVLATAEELAAGLSAKSAMVLEATKAQVAAALAGGDGVRDADRLVAALGDPESRAVGADYLARVRGD